MKKYWKYSKEQLRDVFSTTEQGLSEMQVKKSGKHVGKYTGRGKRPGLLRVFCHSLQIYSLSFADRRAYFHVFRKWRVRL